MCKRFSNPKNNSQNNNMRMLANMSLSIWKNASPRLKRILSTIAILILCLAVIIAGTATPVPQEQASEISNDLNQTVQSLLENDALLQYIFGNNFMICLIMFIPIFGPIFGLYVLYNTGAVIGAIAIAGNFPPLLGFLVLLLTPVAWLEFFAYSIAIAESVWLVRRILQRRVRHELVNASILISICAVLLLLGAIIETVMIAGV